MNSNETIDIKRASEALAYLRQKVEDVLRTEPNLKKIKSLEELSDNKAKVVEEKLWSIFVYGEYYVHAVLKQLAGPMYVVNYAKGNFDFYREEYPQIITKISELIYVSSYPLCRDSVKEWIDGGESFDASFDSPHFLEKYKWSVESGWVQEMVKIGCDLDTSSVRDGPQMIPLVLRDEEKSDVIDTAFRLAIVHGLSTIRDEHEIEERDDYKNIPWLKAIDEHASAEVNKIVDSSYFTPGAWRENQKELFPIIHHTKKLQPHIQTRINEIYRSFIFGNWLAVIALSRSLLEYVLIDKRETLGEPGAPVEVRNENGHTKSLGELIDLAGKNFPELKHRMFLIKKHGNEVLHPPHHNVGYSNSKVVNLKSWVPPRREKAKICIDEISKIISDLYSI